jgi:uncharacterized cupin superfamily protein
LWLLEGESGVPTAIKIDPLTLELSPCAPPASDYLLTATPECKSKILYQRTDGRLSLMLWSSTPYRRRLVPHAKHELMRFFSGAARLYDCEGSTFSCGAPSAVFVPRGTHMAWENESDVLKLACFVS